MISEAGKGNSGSPDSEQMIHVHTGIRSMASIEAAESISLVK